MNPRSFLMLCLSVGMACSALALSPEPGYKPPTYAERWDTSAFVFYGRVTALELNETVDGRDHYQATIRIERSFKGELSGDVRILEMVPDGAGMGFLFEFNRTYVVFAQKAQSDGYFTGAAQRIELPLKRRVSANTLNSIFGYQVVDHELGYELELAEFLEGKTNNTSEVIKLRKIKEERERDRLLREKEARAPFEEAKQAFETAMKEKRVPERKALLEALEKKLNYQHQEEFRDLRKNVSRELSVAVTYFSNGIKNFD